MGDGHNAAADALTESIERIWPGCETRRIDSLRLMGRWISWLFRSVYAFELHHAPWLYQYLYDALWKHLRVAAIEKRIVASWCGRRLAKRIKAFAPDLIISTYPIGSGALDWLRRYRGMAIPTATVMADYAPHPFWIYPGIDVHFVAHDVVIPEAVALGATGDVRAGAPPVRSVFGPKDRVASRWALGLRQDAFIALVTGGGWGVGTLPDAVRVLTSGSPSIQVVAVCGHNQNLLRTLQGFSLPAERLVTLGFVDNMPELMGAADVVVTNAGGVTAVEALAAHRPLLLFDPIAGHGIANADLMEKAGVAVLCRTPAELGESVERLATDETYEARLRKAAVDHMAGKSLEDDLSFLASLHPEVRIPRARTALRRVATTGIAAVLAFLLIAQVATFGATRFAHAARGAPASTHKIAIVVAGALDARQIQAVEREALSQHLAVTFFLQGEAAAASPDLARRLVKEGFEVEASTWHRWSDRLAPPWAMGSDYRKSRDALRRATGVNASYVAQPCGRFSLPSLVATNHLHLRRVVFAQQVALTSEGEGKIPDLRSGAIVALVVRRGASIDALLKALDDVAGQARSDSLRMVTIAVIDGARAEA